MSKNKTPDFIKDDKVQILDNVFGASNEMVIDMIDRTAEKKSKGLFNSLPSFMQKTIEKIWSKPEEFDVFGYFDSIKESVEALNPNEIQNIINEIDNIKTVITTLSAVGQDSMKEAYQSILNLREKEFTLYKSGKIKKVLSEEMIVNFSKTAPKALKLTYLKHYLRVIPLDCVSKILDVLESKLFDNIVILHYDPENKDSKPSKQEVEKAKDPIAFGLINGSRNFYYICDWIDEYCDLTLEDIVETLPEDLKPTVDLQQRLSETVNSSYMNNKSFMMPADNNIVVRGLDG